MSKLKIKSIERRLMRVMKDEYCQNGLYANIVSINEDFIYEEPFVVLNINYGWDKFNSSLKLVYKKDGAFIEGQFYQALIDKEKIE